MQQAYPAYLAEIDAIVEIGTSFHRLGVNAYRIEAALSSLAEKKGLEGQFFFTPTIIIASFKTPDGEIGRHVRIEPGNIDLGRLCAVDTLAHQYAQETISAEGLLLALSKIQKNPELYPQWARLLCFAVGSGGLSLVFAPSVPNLISGLILGLTVGVLDWISGRFDRMRQLQEATAAFVVTVGAIVLKMIFPGVDLDIIILCGLIKLLPGLSLTVALAELSQYHLASGTARFMGAMMSLLKLTFGIILANRILSFLPVFNFNPLDFLNISLPVWSLIPGLLAYSFSTAIVYKAAPQDTWAVFTAGLIGALSIKVGGHFLGADMGAFLAGMVIGALSNYFSNLLSRPVGLFLWPGILIIVPGSFGLKGLSALFVHNYDIGFTALVTTFAVSISLVAGLFFGNLIIRPRSSV
ncbi:MAG: threonine/serine exporter family protein [Bdellovibrio sp.]|nr:threonine/serine exporter family protein [Bdellovibrio sp.]